MEKCKTCGRMIPLDDFGGVWDVVYELCEVGEDYRHITGCIKLHSCVNELLFKYGLPTVTPQALRKILESRGIYKTRSGSMDEDGKRPEIYMGLRLL